MFMLFMWLIVCTAGNVMAGGISVSTTTLAAAVTAAETDTITVTSTTGFVETGVLVIESERMTYPDTTATTFKSNLAQPIIRGFDGTSAVAHPAGTLVRTVESSMMNSVVGYNIAVMADASGLWAAPTIALALLRLMGSFFTLPLGFLGTDLAMLTYIWWILAAGMLLSLAMSFAGGRRVTGG